MDSSAHTERPTGRDRAAQARAQAEEWHTIRRLVRRFGVEVDQADDIAQEVALALHRTPAILDRGVLVRTVAKRKAAIYRRGRGRRFRAMERAATDTRAQTHPPPNAEERMITHGAIAMLRRAIEELKTAAPQLDAVLSLHLEGLTASEIAEVLRIPCGTADTRLRRARATLREQMSRWAAENAHREQWAQLTKGAPRRWR